MRPSNKIFKKIIPIFKKCFPTWNYSSCSIIDSKVPNSSRRVFHLKQARSTIKPAENILRQWIVQKHEKRQKAISTQQKSDSTWDFFQKLESLTPFKFCIKFSSAKEKHLQSPRVIWSLYIVYLKQQEKSNLSEEKLRTSSKNLIQTTTLHSLPFQQNWNFKSFWTDMYFL